MSKTSISTGLIIFLHFIGLSLLAQEKKAIVTGTVKDSLQAPKMYATVSLYKQGQTAEPVKTGYTNDKGNFRLAGIDTGNYTLIISHTGYGDQQQSIRVEGKDIDAGTIILFRAAAALQGVTVTSKKPLIEQQDDKIIFNVENDPATKTENAIDILRKTPFVTVDGDNNVQVNGAISKYC